MSTTVSKPTVKAALKSAEMVLENPKLDAAKSRQTAATNQKLTYLTSALKVAAIPIFGGVIGEFWNCDWTRVLESLGVALHQLFEELLSQL